LKKFLNEFNLLVVEGRRNRKPSRKILDQLAASGRLTSAEDGQSASSYIKNQSTSAATRLAGKGSPARHRGKGDKLQEDPLYKSVQV
jgi:hypothetical protein